MKILGTLLVNLFLLASTSWAVPITFVHIYSDPSTMLVGTLDGELFTANSFTIVAEGDTSSRLSDGPGVFFINHTSAQITIPTNELGNLVLDFVTPTRTFVIQHLDPSNPDIGAVGFAHAGSGGASLFREESLAGDFSTYDLLSSITAMSLGGDVVWGGAPVVTDEGELFFERRFTESARFVAQVQTPGPVTEPGLLGLLALGLLAVKRRSQKS
jgi:MYXO-CTERM domain-containing protein